MATAIANRFKLKNVSVAPILWWRKAIPSAHKAGGSREPSVLYPLLVLAPKASKEPRCVLVDDVKTTGGHLLAGEARLRTAGIRVSGAICAARRVCAEGKSPFEYKTESFDVYDPGEHDDEDAA
jgi:adenine/guanine phosphoribosyltransferase-like PRPP-binding protein